jgi:hypothetical protein
LREREREREKKTEKTERKQLCFSFLLTKKYGVKKLTPLKKYKKYKKMP